MSETLVTCDIRIEMTENPTAHYTGYSSFACHGTGRAATPVEPESAILTGNFEKGAIHFHVDKTIGTDPNGCAVTSLTVTQFGVGQLAAEWEKGTCTGGHVILAKAPR